MGKLRAAEISFSGTYRDDDDDVDDNDNESGEIGSSCRDVVRNCPSTILEGMKKTTKSFREDSESFLFINLYVRNKKHMR
jgi:hypothetical protein